MYILYYICILFIYSFKKYILGIYLERKWL